MTDAALPLDAARATTKTRTLDRSVLVVLAVFTLFALNFGAYRVFGDGLYIYPFTQHLFGDNPHATGYNFGLGLVNAPFYGVGKLAGAVVGHQAKLEAASITIAAITWVLLTALCSWTILVQLELPARGLAVGTAIFGTPVWYYASFSPSYTHAADAAAFAAAAWALLGVWTSPALGWRIGAGAALGLSITIRPFNVGVAAGALLALAAFRRFRDSIATAASTALVYGILVALPLAMGMSLTERTDGTDAESANIGFSPLSPVRMLFTVHRGLFIWTPVTFLGVLGLALLIQRHHARGYLITLAAMGGGLLVMNFGFKQWDGDWSFSERYLSSPVALYAVGVAGLIAYARAGARTAAAVAAIIFTGWSLLIGMNHAFGASQGDGAFTVATKRSVSTFAERTWAYSRVRHVIDRIAP